MIIGGFPAVIGNFETVAMFFAEDETHRHGGVCSCCCVVRRDTSHGVANVSDWRLQCANSEAHSLFSVCRRLENGGRNIGGKHMTQITSGLWSFVNYCWPQMSASHFIWLLKFQFSDFFFLL